MFGQPYAERANKCARRIAYQMREAIVRNGLAPMPKYAFGFGSSGTGHGIST